MRRILLVIIVIAVAGAWLFWQDWSNLRDTAMRYIENGELTTFQARYTAEAILEEHRAELLLNPQYTLQETFIRYQPYLLIDAKYVPADRKTVEGIALWGLCDGEMVLDTDSWEQTHGFADAIEAGATRSDFKVLFALAKRGGSSTLEQLQNDLHLEPEALKPWLDSVQQKHLVIPLGREMQLHFQNPKLLVLPQTKIKQTFVSKEYHHGECLSRRYSRNQIEKNAQAAFGSNFTIRNSSEVYLPVYGISVLNPDKSVTTTYWNAVNGKRLTAMLSGFPILP